MLKYRGFVINRLSLIGAKFVCPFTRQKQIYKQKTYTKKKKKIIVNYFEVKNGDLRLGEERARIQKRIYYREFKL